LLQEQLLVDFPYIPKPHVRKTFFANNALYSPTYLFLTEEKKKKRLPYNTKTIPSRVTGKGKAKQDPAFDEEREWLMLKLQREVALIDAEVAEQVNEQEYEDCVDGIECGCCFSTYPFVCLSLSLPYKASLIRCHNCRTR
jgi:TRIAD3 protein (E3 ubiquitin-protein ligase RNF216)